MLWVRLCGKQPKVLNFHNPNFQPERRMNSLRKQLSKTVRKYILLDQNTELPLQRANVPPTISVLAIGFGSYGKLNETLQLVSHYSLLWTCELVSEETLPLPSGFYTFWHWFHVWKNNSNSIMLGTGVLQGHVLSPLVFTLQTRNCEAKHEQTWS